MFALCEKNLHHRKERALWSLSKTSWPDSHFLLGKAETCKVNFDVNTGKKGDISHLKYQFWLHWLKSTLLLEFACSHTFPKLPLPMTFKKSKSVGLALQLKWQHVNHEIMKESTGYNQTTKVQKFWIKKKKSGRKAFIVLTWFDAVMMFFWKR